MKMIVLCALGLVVQLAFFINGKYLGLPTLFPDDILKRLHDVIDVVTKVY
jgi:hypothetical protein